MERIKIQVTEQDINRGRKHSTANCPIAKAIRRQVKEKQTASSGANVISVTPEHIRFGDYVDKTVSRSAKRFMNKFDRGGEVRPFSFIVKV